MIRSHLLQLQTAFNQHSARERFIYLLVFLFIWLELWYLFGYVPVKKSLQATQMQMIDLQQALSKSALAKGGHALTYKKIYPYGQNLTPVMETLMQSDKSVHLDNITQPSQQQSIDLTVRGQFFNLVAYLRQLDQMPWCLSWDKLQYHVENYPDSKVLLTVHTETA